MTTLAREDLAEEVYGNNDTEKHGEGFRGQGYEDIGEHCYYCNGTMLVLEFLFEDLKDDDFQGDTDFLSLDYFLSLDDGEETPETLMIKDGVRAVCGGHVACKITRVQGGYAFPVPSREVAREISQALLRLLHGEFCKEFRLEDIKKGDAWREKEIKNLKFTVLVLLLLMLTLLGAIFL